MAPGDRRPAEVNVEPEVPPAAHGICTAVQCLLMQQTGTDAVDLCCFRSQRQVVHLPFPSSSSERPLKVGRWAEPQERAVVGGGNKLPLSQNGIRYRGNFTNLYIVYSLLPG